MWTYRQGDRRTHGQTEGGVDRQTDRHYKTNNRCFVTAPKNECICCPRSLTGEFVLDNKILKLVIDFFTILRLRCLQTKSNCCVITN